MKRTRWGALTMWLRAGTVPPRHHHELSKPMLSTSGTPSCEISALSMFGCHAGSQILINSSAQHALLYRLGRRFCRSCWCRPSTRLPLTFGCALSLSCRQVGAGMAASQESVAISWQGCRLHPLRADLAQTLVCRQADLGTCLCVHHLHLSYRPFRGADVSSSQRAARPICQLLLYQPKTLVALCNKKFT